MAKKALTIAGWFVHFYTGLGAPLALLQLHALFTLGSFEVFLFLNLVAVFVDATDGTLARAVDIKKTVPNFDGALLDNILDYMTFTFLPTCALLTVKTKDFGSQFAFTSAAGGLAMTWRLAVITVLPLMSSAFQFCNTTAKTTESFMGFPSYWNILVIYVYYLKPNDNILVGLYIGCSFLSFLPVHFIYPTKCKKWMPITLVFSAVWSVMLLYALYKPFTKLSTQILLASLFFPVYYVVASAYLNFTGYFTKPKIS